MNRWYHVDIIKMEMVFAILVISVLMCTTPARGEYPAAAHNYSTHEVRITDGFCPGTTALFIDEFSDDKNVLGRYLGYAVVFQPNTPPLTLENVLVIAVHSIANSKVEISSVLQHECIHHQQRLRYDTYFAFQEAFQTLHRAFEEEAYRRGAFLEVFNVAAIGKPRERVEAFFVFQ